METIRITKKALAEQARDQVFTGRGTKINVIWFDWKSGDYVENGITKSFTGSKYMVAVVGTKKQALERMWIWLNQGTIGYSPYAKHWMATEDKFSRKMPLSFDWNNFKSL